MHIILLNKLRFDQISCSGRCDTHWQHGVPKWYEIVIRLGTHALIECEFGISGHTQKYEDFETIREKLTTYSILTECFKAVVAGLWTLWLFIWLAVKN